MSSTVSFLYSPSLHYLSFAIQITIKKLSFGVKKDDNAAFLTRAFAGHVVLPAELSNNVGKAAFRFLDDD